MHMSDDETLSLASARDAADRGELSDWVARFLSSPGSDNAALAETLTRGERWWAGPVELPFDELHRLAGPSDAPVLGEFGDDDLETVDEMEESIDDGWEPPPLIVSYRDGQLVLEDGNHRVEGLRRNGVRRGWSIICFERRDERDAFTVPA
jgi:hypothetical protein